MTLMNNVKTWRAIDTQAKIAYNIFNQKQISIRYSPIVKKRIAIKILKIPAHVPEESST
jgi:hypothetical protein